MNIDLYDKFLLWNIVRKRKSKAKKAVMTAFPNDVIGGNVFKINIVYHDNP